MDVVMCVVDGRRDGPLTSYLPGGVKDSSWWTGYYYESRLDMSPNARYREFDWGYFVYRHLKGFWKS